MELIDLPIHIDSNIDSILIVQYTNIVFFTSFDAIGGLGEGGVSLCPKVEGYVVGLFKEFDYLSCPLQTQKFQIYHSNLF